MRGPTLAFLWMVLGMIGSACGEPGVPSASPAALAPVLGVDELMTRDPMPRARIAVLGVVSAVDARSKTLALIDRTEFERCRVTSCASLTLPVSWSGAMPSVGQLARLQGQVTEAGGKLVFAARQVEVIKPMLAVYLNVLGAGFLPFAKPAATAVTALSVMAAWCWIENGSRSGRGAKSCAPGCGGAITDRAARSPAS